MHIYLSSTILNGSFLQNIGDLEHISPLCRFEGKCASVTEPTRREACGSICRLLFIDMVTKQAGSKTSANRYDTDKAESNPPNGKAKG